MVEWLSSVLSRIADGTLLPAAYYGTLDCDAALEAREGDNAFDQEWVEQLKEVDVRWAAADVATDARGLAEAVTKESFLAVSGATGQHEIASFVSDDFDLVVRGRLTGLQGGLLDQLWAVYERGEFSRPPLGTDSKTAELGAAPDRGPEAAPGR